jgi:hypothetical protein
MRRFRSTVPKLALVALAPFLMGVDRCDGSPVMDFLRELTEIVTGLDERVAELEACDCGGILAPVCGEDGLSYVNRCKASCAEVSVVHIGPCETPVCRGDEDCAKEEFCEFEACLDDTLAALRIGECVSVPNGCPEIFDPVCGCDGVTYDNDCFRQEARVSKAHDGRCDEPPPRCGGIGGFECPSPGQVCIFEPGTCHIVDNMGECVERPDACIEIWDPVCGCDGQTYSNECHAVMAGVSIDHEGECRAGPALCGGIAGFECPSEGEVCIFERGTCHVADNMGECVERPDSCWTCPENSSDVCYEILAPVCGCDGNTYDNSCRALMEGVSIDHFGSCQPPSCGGIEGLQCVGPDYTCIFPPGACEMPDAAGECVRPPSGCTFLYSPVCGCDGRTYGNECAALSSGVSVLYEGECRVRD